MIQRGGRSRVPTDHSARWFLLHPIVREISRTVIPLLRIATQSRVVVIVSSSGRWLVYITLSDLGGLEGFLRR